MTGTEKGHQANLCKPIERREEAALNNTWNHLQKTGRDTEFQVASEGHLNMASTIFSSQNSPRWHNNRVATLLYL